MAHELTKITKELILSRLDEIREELQLNDKVYEKISEEFKQIQILEDDILRGKKIRLEKAIIDNNFEEIN